MKQPLKDQAMIVAVKVKKWSGRKFDRKATSEINKLHSTKNAGRFNKILIEESEIKKISKVENNIRAFQYENTLPWGDNGDRLLPAVHYFKYVQGLKPLIDEFNQLTDQFVGKYKSLIKSRRKELNGLFNQSDYPSPSEISERFGIKLSFQPMPNVDDFRLNLSSDTELEALREEIGAEITDRHTQAIKDLYGRCYEAIKRIIDTLQNSDVKFFKNTMVDNVKKLTEILPALNYNNDPKLTQLGQEMKSLVIEPSNLRKDKEAQRAYLDRAKQLDQMFF